MRIKGLNFKYVRRESEIILVNNFMDIVSLASSECYNSKKKKTYEEKKRYISKRVEAGHESILEHSNVVMLLTLPIDEDLVEILTHCRYLHTVCKYKDKKCYLLIGGSIRGYKNIFREIDNTGNPILKLIKDKLYYTDDCFFTDFIEKGIMEKRRFINLSKSNDIEKELYSTNKLDIYSMDNPHEMLRRVDEFEKGIFNLEDMLEMCTVSIHFKKVSRVVSQQLTRHRAAISQKSQRYVDYSNYDFLSPDLFKKEKYNRDKIYPILIKDTVGNETFISNTLYGLGKELMKIYPQLIEQGLLKEDARAYLPNNVESSLWMTYTFKQLIYVIKLRTDKAAQAEVQLLFKEIKEGLNRLLENSSYDDYLLYLTPKFENNRIEDTTEIIE